MSKIMAKTQNHAPFQSSTSASATTAGSDLITINLNGEILKTEQAKVSVYDRSYLYGDSLYEVARTYNGKFFLLEDHLKRLEQSAKLCYMEFSQSLKQFEDEYARTLKAYYAQPGASGTEAYGRIIVSRGVGKIGFGKNCVQTPTQFTIIVQPLEPPTPELWERGYKLKVVDRLRNHPRAIDPAMKSGNYLNCVLAYLEAQEEKFDDALLCNADGHVTEGTTFNIFYVKRDVIVTPPLDIGVLHGITRRLVLDTAEDLGMEVREVRFPKERLYDADEVFLTSSIREVFPVTQVDDVKKGKPGKLTRQLLEEFRKIVADSTDMQEHA